VPPALRKKYPKGQLSVNLADKSGEKYTPPPPPPPPAYISFSGQGVSLSEPKNTKFTKKPTAPENYIL
jgi:hypothetical protein